MIINKLWWIQLPSEQKIEKIFWKCFTSSFLKFSKRIFRCEGSKCAPIFARLSIQKRPAVHDHVLRSCKPGSKISKSYWREQLLMPHHKFLLSNASRHKNGETLYQVSPRSFRIIQSCYFTCTVRATLLFPPARSCVCALVLALFTMLAPEAAVARR